MLSSDRVIRHGRLEKPVTKAVAKLSKDGRMKTMQKKKLSKTLRKKVRWF